MTSLIFGVIGLYILRIRNNQNLFVANRYSSISCIKDKGIATCADVTRLLLMFENLRLTLAKKRCEWECNKTIISENFCVFPFVKTSGYHLKVFVFQLKQIHICQTTIVEKHLRRYYVRMNSMSKPGRVAQSVTCLATDACLTADPGVASSIPARYHTFVEIDHEIISTVILFASADLFKKGCCQLQAKVCAQISG